jgi:hypothetical protein
MNNASSSHLDAVSTDFMSLLFKGSLSTHFYEASSFH